MKKKEEMALMLIEYGALSVPNCVCLILSHFLTHLLLPSPCPENAIPSPVCL
jgi:hypothetical protein